jgi:AraC family transcriptional regulator
MVCDRCKAAVRQVLKEQGLTPVQVELGAVSVAGTLDTEALRRLDDALIAQGFGLVTDADTRIVTAIKAAIVQLVHGGNATGRVKLSEHLPALLHREYSGLSALFSQLEGITIEHYYLRQRVERVKELLQYGELTVGEIAFRTGFSSAAHLSAQFKQLTGMTPTAFKQRGQRRTLDAI